MKKCLALLAALVLVMGLAACGGGKTPETTAPTTEATTAPTTVPTEPTTVPTTAPAEPSALVGGIDLTGMTTAEAAEALNAAAANYRLSLNVNGKTLSFSAEDLGLKLDEEALGKYLEALKSGSELPASIFTYDRAALKTLLSDKLDTKPVNATVTYNSSKKQFAANDGKNGTAIDADAAADAAAAALGLLNGTAEAEVKTTSVAPELTASSEKVKSAVNTANGYLKVSLTYTYSPEGGSSSKESIGVSTLSTFVKVSEKMEVSVSKSAIESYASRMSDKYSGGDYKGAHKSTGLTVTYYGQRVNKSALVDDIYSCITSGKSGKMLIAAVEKTKVKFIGWGENGFRELTTSKGPIHKPADMNGMKLRVCGTPIFIDIFSALGTNPQAINWSEAVTGFQQGIVDGQENPTNGINIPLQVWTWHKYHTDWHYMIDPLLLTANQKVWKEFSAEDQKILMECAKDMEKYSKALSRLGFDDGSSLAYLQSIGKVPAVTDPYKTLADKGMNGVKFTPEMIKEFYEATQSVRDKWTKEIGEDLVKAAEADMKAAQ
mgnify:CR=1 FL=1